MQLSLDGTRDRAVGSLPLSVVVGTNAELLRSVAPLYLTGSVLDVTYGSGKWWAEYRPAGLVTHDIALDGVDFRKLPERDSSFDAVCFDPPYVPQGGIKTPFYRSGQWHQNYGLVPMSLAELRELFADGLAECARVSRRWVLVKCCDFVTGGQFKLAHLFVIAKAEELGLQVHDLLVLAGGSGPGNSRMLDVKRARRAHSYLLVFRK